MVTKLCQFGHYEALSQASRCRHAALDPRHYGSYMDSHFKQIGIILRLRSLHEQSMMASLRLPRGAADS